MQSHLLVQPPLDPLCPVTLFLPSKTLCVTRSALLPLLWRGKNGPVSPRRRRRSHPSWLKIKRGARHTERNHISFIYFPPLRSQKEHNSRQQPARARMTQPPITPDPQPGGPTPPPSFALSVLRPCFRCARARRNRPKHAAPPFLSRNKHTNLAHIAQSHNPLPPHTQPPSLFCGVGRSLLCDSLPPLVLPPHPAQARASNPISST
jgi:hypothetical protein